MQRIERAMMEGTAEHSLQRMRDVLPTAVTIVYDAVQEQVVKALYEAQEAMAVEEQNQEYPETKTAEYEGYKQEAEKG